VWSSRGIAGFVWGWQEILGVKAQQATPNLWTGDGRQMPRLPPFLEGYIRHFCTGSYKVCSRRASAASSGNHPEYTEIAIVSNLKKEKQSGCLPQWRLL
jgi:hypothetical protein